MKLWLGAVGVAFAARWLVGDVLGMWYFVAIVLVTTFLEARDMSNDHQNQLIANLTETDTVRKVMGSALIVAGLVGLYQVAVVAQGFMEFDLNGKDLDKFIDLLNTSGFPYWIGARATVGAAGIGALLTVIRTGVRMLLPAVYVRDMLQKSSSTPTEQLLEMAQNAASSKDE